ncbi:alpha/beta fold hydrolase [Sphingoaurantiacus capsulatus]|uniref:Alpha/beta fold hydrolase n=1 Tax=Sphingoaurantiacus capsulatus TaxID=1771310 RepID=A0ABV7X6E2_9SPHN
MHRRLLLLSAALLLAGAAPPTGELPRTTVFGVSGTPQPASDGSTGVRADTIAAGLTGAKLGLKAGDIVTEINGMEIADMGAFAAAASKIEASKPVRATVWRAGKRQVLTTTSVGRPLESYRNGTAHYGAVPFRGGLLREVMVAPPGGAKGPVLFLIQGYTCDSFETTREDSPHRLLFDGLLARGISVYRIEKAQAGDSRGGPSCRTGDFDAEMAGFETGYRALMEKHGIAPDRIFMLGHSMGGVEAPLLAAKVAAPRGVAVYGTVLRNWHDYMFDIFRIQGFTGGGADPVDGETGSEKLRPLFRALLLEGRTPAALAAANPEYAKLLRELLQWDGGDQIMARHYSFWQGLAKQRLVTAWRDTRSNVLSVYGEGDVAAIDNRDHQLIADMVNHWRPGTARFVEVPRTGHGMTIDGSMAEVRAGRAPTANRPRPAFNSDLIPLFGDWIEATMREPAVATRFPAKG